MLFTYSSALNDFRVELVTFKVYLKEDVPQLIHELKTALWEREPIIFPQTFVSKYKNCMYILKGASTILLKSVEL